jgi:DNA (cytosine-5)-methyltransferase 1
MGLTVVDLFSGIGGFTLGLGRSGFKTVLFCETDPYCRSVLTRYWPSVPIHPDINSLTGKYIETLAPQIDLVCGGFPCQDISVAGRRAGLAGKRSGLWWQMFRIICEVRPNWLLIENVPNLRTRGADSVLAALEGAGYTCWPVVVGAWALGTPHKRDRVWILGHAQHHGPPASAFGGSIEAAIYDGAERPEQARKPAGASPPRVLSRPALPSQTARESQEKWPAGFGCTQHGWEAARLVEPGMGRATHGISSRVHRLRALGNAVVPSIPEIFGRFILQTELGQHGQHPGKGHTSLWRT